MAEATHAVSTSVVTNETNWAYTDSICLIGDENYEAMKRTFLAVGLG